MILLSLKCKPDSSKNQRIVFVGLDEFGDEIFKVPYIGKSLPSHSDVLEVIRKIKKSKTNSLHPSLHYNDVSKFLHSIESFGIKSGPSYMVPVMEFNYNLSQFRSSPSYTEELISQYLNQYSKQVA